MTYPWSEKQWKSIEEKNYALYIAKSGPILAFALYQLSPAESLAHLLKIVVAPTQQGVVSSSFFAMQKNSLSSLGLSRIYLEVSEKNLRAQQFYKKMGFELLRVAKNYYTDGSQALMMQLHL